jgi:hypothetical protein
MLPVVPPLLAQHAPGPAQLQRQPRREALAAIGCPANAGPAEPATKRAEGAPLTASARERTSAGVFRAGLPVSGPTSLAASARLLFSVTACGCLINRHYPQNPADRQGRCGSGWIRRFWSRTDRSRCHSEWPVLPRREASRLSAARLNEIPRPKAGLGMTRPGRPNIPDAPVGRRRGWPAIRSKIRVRRRTGAGRHRPDAVWAPPDRLQGANHSLRQPPSGILV